MEDKIKKEAILSGSTPIAAYQEEGVVLRARSLDRILRIVIHNIPTTGFKVVNLWEHLPYDIRMIAHYIDAPGDNMSVPPTQMPPIDRKTATINMKTVKNGITKLNFFFNSLTAFSASESFILFRDESLHLQSTIAIDTYEIICYPIYVEPSVVIF